MVGRPNFPEDVDRRPDLRGSAEGTPGLDALDQEREASLADEGGAAGAVVETQDEDDRRKRVESLPVSHLVECQDVTHSHDEKGEVSRSVLWALTGAMVAGMLGLLLLRRV